MIARMKKITLLVTEKDSERFLLSLRKAGIVHVNKIKEPPAEKLSEVNKELADVDKAVEILSACAAPDAGGAVSLNEKDLSARASEIVEAMYMKEQSLGAILHLNREKKWFDSWGKIDPEDIRSLRGKGVEIKLYRLHGNDYKKIKDKSALKVVGKDKAYLYVVQAGSGPLADIGLEETPIPAKSLPAIEEEIKGLSARAEKAEEFLRNSAGYRNALKQIKASLTKRHEFLSVRHGMPGEESFSYLQGFCPAKEAGQIVSLAGRAGAGYLLEDPDETQGVPTLITNPRWIDIISPVFKFMNTVPGYAEFDISLVFLIFFSLFFAMIVGDGGYGVIFLVLTFLVRRKAKGLPGQPFFLMYLLGGATVAWGAVTGTWFGAERIGEMPFLRSLVIGKINSFADTNQDFMMYLCFLIGAAHLTIAHIMKILRFINSPRLLGDIGWISIVWGMFYAAGSLVIAKPFPPFGGYLLGAGILLVLLFSNFQKNIFKGMMTTLTDLPLSVIAAFSDVVSYIRLFAVGYASVIVAGSFNKMAVGDGINGVVSGLVAALILFFGHALNITLALMAVIVHGIRLNMLEFSGHLGMQWTGKEYSPFAE